MLRPLTGQRAWRPAFGQAPRARIADKIDAIAEGKALWDTTTLADPPLVAKLKEQDESQE